MEYGLALRVHQERSRHHEALSAYQVLAAMLQDEVSEGELTGRLIAWPSDEGE